MSLDHIHGETSARRLYWATLKVLLLIVFHVAGDLVMIDPSDLSFLEEIKTEI